MVDVFISKGNSTFIQVNSNEPSIIADISDHFSFEIPNKLFNPAVKYGNWDGVIHLFNTSRNTLYLGLAKELINFLKTKGYSYKIDDDLVSSDNYSSADILKLIQKNMVLSTDGVKISPYDYQLDAVTYMINNNRSIVLAATSAGKSLILYLTIRLYQLQEEMKGKKIIIIVPSSGLVEQMYNDFCDYSELDPNWDVSEQCQKISGKYKKDLISNVIITTWQSAKNIPTETINFEAGAVFVDECHGCRGEVLKTILEGLTDVSVRHGLTGTLDNIVSNEFLIQGLLGPAKRIVKAIDLMKNGAASKIDIHVLMLEYPDEIKKELQLLKDECEQGTEKYRLEMDFLSICDERNKVIKNITEAYDGNSLILYNNLLHGESIANCLNNVLTINGEVKIDEREDIRQQIESENGVNLVASYGTCSTGISIKKLHNLILASPSKSIVRVLQSVGRMMRKHSSKERGYVIDIVDVLGDNCYCVKHALERIKYYRNEQFNIRYINIKL